MFKILFVRLPMSPKVDINVYRTNLLHCAFCVPYPSLISTLRAYAPYPSLISALGACVPLPSSISASRAFALSCYKYRCVCRPHAKKFHIVMKEYGHTQRCNFSVGNPLFGQVWPKNQFVSLSWNLVSWPIRICRIQWWCSLLFLTRNILFG